MAGDSEWKGSARAWMARISNPISKDIPARWAEHLEFCTWQLEVGEEGTPHLQIYFVTKSNPSNKNGFTKKQVLERITGPGVWLGKRKGTHDQAVAYCNKRETRQDGHWTFGKWEETAGSSSAAAKGGAKNASKILAIKSAIDDGATEEELYEGHFGEMLRYGKAFDRYRLVKKNLRRDWQTRSLVLWGPPGTGKSMRAKKIAEATFGNDVFYWDISGDRHFMDGYCGQRCVVINEFFGQLPINWLCKFLDRYPMQVETKGSAVPFAAEMVIFTSNEHPDDWYGKHDVHGAPSKIPQVVLDALKRRFRGKLGSIIEMKDLVVIEDDVPDFDETVKEMIRAAEEMDKELASSPIIDLTAEEVDRWDDDISAEQAEDGEYQEEDRICMLCQGDDDSGWVCAECVDSDAQATREVDGYVTPPPSQKAPFVPPRPVQLARTDSTVFAIQRPPKGASAADFRANKQIPGQSRLELKRRRSNDDDDNDRDDK